MSEPYPSIWKDDCILPMLDSVKVIMNDGSILNGYEDRYKVDKPWCYLDDLISQVERQSKALELANKGFDDIVDGRLYGTRAHKLARKNHNNDMIYLSDYEQIAKETKKEIATILNPEKE